MSYVNRTPGSDINLLLPLMGGPSRITTNSCTLRDNVFTNQTNYSVRTELLIYDIRDHLLIFIVCNYDIEIHKSDTFKYVIRVKDVNFIESMRQEKWHDVLEAGVANLAYTRFVNIFSTFYNHHCLVKKVKQTYRKKAWFTNGFNMRVVRRMFYIENVSRIERKLRSLDIKHIKINKLLS